MNPPSPALHSAFAVYVGVFATLWALYDLRNLRRLLAEPERGAVWWDRCFGYGVGLGVAAFGLAEISGLFR